MLRHVLIDFDGVAGVVNRGTALAAAEPIRHWFRVDPDRVIDDYFYGNPRNGDLDLGRVRVREVREADRPALWSGPADVWQAWWQAVENSYEFQRPLAALVDRWRTNARFVLVTDNHLDFGEWLARRSDFAGRFDALVCSAETGIKKPDPRVFQRTVGAGGCLAEAVYLDDSAVNVAAAQALGLRSIHVTDIQRAVEELEALLAAAFGERKGSLK